MTISFPLTTIMSATSFEDQRFQLVSRQEISRLSVGKSVGKDLGPALWTASYTTIPMLNDDALAYEAALESLDGLVQTFEAYDKRRVYPRSDPTGATYNDGVLVSVNANNKKLALSGLIASQVVSAGDYLSFSYGSSRALHRVVEGVTANGAGLTAEFEVRPHIRSGWVISPSTTVKLKAPSGIFMLVPGSVSISPVGGAYSKISFQAVQALE